MSIVEQTPVDPWLMQRTLMDASNQIRPAAPELNKGVLLYQALNFEEGAETVDGIRRALTRILSTTNPLNFSKEQIALASILQTMGDCMANMKQASLEIRRQLHDVDNGFRAAMTRSEVKEIADGCTDLTVTNCGLAISVGLNGPACYQDVAGSNLSKRNPDTGLIDKTPDGKWIKNPRSYVEPNLEMVIYGDVRPELADVPDELPED